jgi:hypothetical protein
MKQQIRRDKVPIDKQHQNRRDRQQRDTPLRQLQGMANFTEEDLDELDELVEDVDQD